MFYCARVEYHRDGVTRPCCARQARQRLATNTYEWFCNILQNIFRIKRCLLCPCYRGVSTSKCRAINRAALNLKSRGAICFLSADNARNFYQCHVVQVSSPVPDKNGTNNSLPDFVWPHAAREARGAAAKLPPHNDH